MLKFACTHSHACGANRIGISGKESVVWERRSGEELLTESSVAPAAARGLALAQRPEEVREYLDQL